MSGVYTTDNSWMEEVDFSDEEQRCKALDARDEESFNGMLGIRFAEQGPDRTGFLHGGVTLALVEAAASRAVDMRADYEKERPFGVHIEIDHKKPGRQGVLRAIATFDHQEKNKQIWNIEVRDEDDDIVSDGIFVTKIVSLERLAQKQAEREGK